MTNGKGDGARPKSVTEQEYAERWARTFRQPPPPTKEPDERPADRSDAE